MSAFDGARARVAGAAGLNGGGVSSGQLAAAVADRAPANANYVVQTANGSLPNAQALGALSTGILKVTTTTGVLSVASGSDLPSHTHANVVVSLAFLIDGGGATITTGIKGDLLIPVAGTLQQWTLLADQSGSIVVDLWKDSYANYPPTIADVITASAKPTISSSTKAQSSALTGWTTSLSYNDVLRVNVNSVTSIQRVMLILSMTRSV